MRHAVIAKPVRLALAGLFALCFAASELQAGSYTVDPVKIVLTPDKRAAAMRVQNTQNQPVTIQVDARQWSGVDTDSTTDLPRTQELIVVPPTFTLQPGQRQVVRAGLRKPSQSDQEVAYRLVFKEVPPAPGPDTLGLQLALQLSIPVFVQPDRAVKHDMHWQLQLQANGQLDMVARNDGDAHFKMASWRLQRTGGKDDIASFQGLVYVLPGTSHHWLVDATSALHRGEEIELVLESAGRILRMPIRVD